MEMSGAMATLAEGRDKLTLPVLVMHGEGDVMTPSAGSEAFVAGVGSEDKTLRLYPELFHEIFNEPEQGAVLEDLGSWLDARIAPAAKAAPLADAATDSASPA